MSLLLTADRANCRPFSLRRYNNNTQANMSEEEEHAWMVYIGGETKFLSVNCDTGRAEFATPMVGVCGPSF